MPKHSIKEADILVVDLYLLAATTKLRVNKISIHVWIRALCKKDRAKALVKEEISRRIFNLIKYLHLYYHVLTFCQDFNLLTFL